MEKCKVTIRMTCHMRKMVTSGLIAKSDLLKLLLYD